MQSEDIFLQAMESEKRISNANDSANVVKNGVVVAIKEKDVFLNLGGKSEVIVPLDEFDTKPEIGMEVKFVQTEVKEGVNLGSITAAKKAVKQEEVRNAFMNKTPIEGKITDVVYKEKDPKGFLVDIGIDIKAFLPLSQVDTRRVERPEQLIGNAYKFAVMEFRRGNVTVSHREYAYKMIKSLYVEFFGKHNVGDVVQGKVLEIEENHLIIDIEGIRAFMHISDFSWKYLNDLRKFVKTGDEMEVKIVSLDKTKDSVKVGKKQLIPNPWENIEQKYSVGDVINAKVIKYKREGVTIEVEDGIEAFLHVSEMSWTQKIKDPKRFVAVGSLVEVKIKSIEADKSRMDVSLRDVQDNPWDNALSKYPDGKVVQGTVSSILDFGLFVKLEDGIEGLIRKEDVDWMDQNIELKNKYKKGDTISAIVMSVDTEKEKLRLGLKQMSDNPYKNFSSSYPKGSLVKATVTSLGDDRVFVMLDNNIEGFIHISNLDKTNVDKVADVVKVGDELQAVVKFIDSSKNKIELSRKDYLMNEEKLEVSKYMAKPSQDDGLSTTMGSLLKDAFKDIKLADEPKKAVAKKEKTEDEKKAPAKKTEKKAKSTEKEDGEKE